MPYFWMVSGCTVSGIGPFLRHFHTSAKKNDPSAILSHNSVGACSTDPTCNVSVAKSYYCRAGQGIINYLPIRERLYQSAVLWDRAAFSLDCNCDTCCLIRLFIWKIKSHPTLKASLFLQTFLKGLKLLSFLLHVCSEMGMQPCWSRARPTVQQQGCLLEIALESTLPFQGEKLGLVKMLLAKGRCSSILHTRWSIILDLCPCCRRRRNCKQEHSMVQTA